MVSPYVSSVTTLVIAAPAYVADPVVLAPSATVEPSVSVRLLPVQVWEKVILAAKTVVAAEEAASKEIANKYGDAGILPNGVANTGT